MTTALGSVLVAAVFAYLMLAVSGIDHLNDFYKEAWPSYRALDRGDLGAFISHAPAYIGSLVLRAPFVLLSRALGGDRHAAYYASALPCLVVAAAFGGWLTQVRPDAAVRGRALSRMAPLLLVLFGPFTWIALEFGHPEDILGSALCVAAVVLAVDGRLEWSGVFLALAVVNKAWALIAVPVAIAVLPTRREQVRALAVTLIVGGLGAAALVLTHHASALSFGAAGDKVGAVKGGVLFAPPELLWFFGRFSWIAEQAHVLIIVVAAVVAGIWWLTRRPPAGSATPVGEALLLLALVSLLRAALDPIDNLYYHLPFLFALIAWEVLSARTLWRSLAVTVVFTIVVSGDFLPKHADDFLAILYAAMVLPILAWLAARLWLAPGPTPATSGTTTTA
jgi:hypothetical protein